MRSYVGLDARLTECYIDCYQRVSLDDVAKAIREVDARKPWLGDKKIGIVRLSSDGIETVTVDLDDYLYSLTDDAMLNGDDTPGGLDIYLSQVVDDLPNPITLDDLMRYHDDVAVFMRPLL